MAKYEVLVLARPEITETEASNIETQFSALASKIKGKVISWEKWGKYRLAYPVKGNDYGVYYLTRVEIPDTEKNSVIKEIKSLFDIRFNEIIMRYLISHLDSTQSLEYKKPAPLDETPKGVDEFLKENKMEGLMKDKKSNIPPKSHKPSSEEISNG
jgi:ribosomal protein S6